MDFLENLLADGKMPQTKIAELADEQGISNKTLRNAKKALNIQAVKDGNADGEKGILRCKEVYWN